jgi:hypothetical protein
LLRIGISDFCELMLLRVCAGRSLEGYIFLRLLVCRQGEVVVIREQRKIDSGRAVEGTGLQGG